MRLATLVRKGLFQKKLRTFLLASSIAMAFLIFGVLAGFLATVDPAASGESTDELMVSNRINILQPLPLSYRDRIAEIPGVALVSQVNILAGYYKEERNDVSALIVDPQSFLESMREDLVLAPAERQAFLATRDAIIADQATAERWGWKLGDRITLTSGLYLTKEGSREWPFTLVGIYTSASEDDPVTGVFGQYAYLNNNAANGRDGVHWFGVKTRHASMNDAVAAAIDREFSNSAAETKTQPGLAFAQAFLAQFGNLKLIVGLVVGAGFVTILFIVANTIALTVRQRRKQIATLKALGFRPGHVLTIVMGEALLLAAIGGAIGLGAASILLSGVHAAIGGAVPALGLPGSVWATGCGLIVMLGLLSGALPALGALRLKPVDALARS